MLGLSFMHTQELWPGLQLTRQGSTNGCAVPDVRSTQLFILPLTRASSRCCRKEDKKQSKSRLILPQRALLAPSTAILAHRRTGEEAT